VSGAYRIAILNRTRPSVIALSRQACPNHEGSAIEHVALGAYTLHEAPPAGDKPLQLCLVASGSEVRRARARRAAPRACQPCPRNARTHARAHRRAHAFARPPAPACRPLARLLRPPPPLSQVGLTVQVAELLGEEGVRVRVVSMPCWELFDEQTLDYRKSVFPKGVPVLAVEAASVEVRSAPRARRRSDAATREGLERRPARPRWASTAWRVLPPPPSRSPHRPRLASDPVARPHSRPAV
jgi:hypothetical protein